MGGIRGVVMILSGQQSRRGPSTLWANQGQWSKVPLCKVPEPPAATSPWAPAFPPSPSQRTLFSKFPYPSRWPWRPELEKLRDSPPCSVIHFWPTGNIYLWGPGFQVYVVSSQMQPTNLILRAHSNRTSPWDCSGCMDITQKAPPLVQDSGV